MPKAAITPRPCGGLIFPKNDIRLLLVSIVPVALSNLTR